MDLRRLTRNFILGESQYPSVASYLHSLSEVIGALTPRTKADALRIENAKASLREVRRHVRRLQERVNVLEEQVKILEENKET